MCFFYFYFLKGSPLWFRFKDSRSSTLDGDSYSLHDNGTLEIRISRPRDSGKYTCVARNILGISENHVFLEVKGEGVSVYHFRRREAYATSSLTACFSFLSSEPTQILKQPEYRMIKRGGPVTFECKVKHDSSLIPTMTWLKDDEELPEDDRLEHWDVSLVLFSFENQCWINVKID